MQQSLTLVPVHPTEAALFRPELLRARRFGRVHQIRERSKDHVVLDCTLLDSADALADPEATPLLVGTVARSFRTLDGETASDYQIRAFWENQLWRVLDEETVELFSFLHGLDAQKVRRFAQALVPPALLTPED